MPLAIAFQLLLDLLEELLDLFAVEIHVCKLLLRLVDLNLAPSLLIHLEFPKTNSFIILPKCQDVLVPLVDNDLRDDVLIGLNNLRHHQIIVEKEEIVLVSEGQSRVGKNQGLDVLDLDLFVVDLLDLFCVFDNLNALVGNC